MIISAEEKWHSGQAMAAIFEINVARFGHGTMSDLSPLCEAKRTLTKRTGPPRLA
jgi:hypothetical protein